MMDRLRELLTVSTLLWGAGLFVVTFVLSLAVVAFILVQLPADYFSPRRPPPIIAANHPIIRWAFLIGKNLVGVALIVLGVALSLPGIPGQGLITVLIGVMLVNFPGKSRLERWLVLRPAVLRTVNRVRQKFGKPPLVFDPLPDPG